MTQANIDNISRMAEEDATRIAENIGGLPQSYDSWKVPRNPAFRKAGRTPKKQTRCRFCGPWKKIADNTLARHTMLTHQDAVRSLDNPTGALAMFNIGNDMGGQKGSYLVYRAFYNLLKHSGAINSLPEWTDLGEVKWESDVQTLAVGNPIVDNRVFVESEQESEDLVILPPTPGVEVSEVDTSEPGALSPAFEQDVLLDSSDSEAHDCPSDFENHYDELLDTMTQLSESSPPNSSSPDGLVEVLFQ